MPASRRNLAVLALCQALAMTSMTMVMTTIALIGGGNPVGVAIVVDELDPIWAAAVRFLAAGAIFALATVLLRVPLPHGRAFTGALLYGVLGFAVQVNGHGGAGQPEDAQSAAVFQSVDPDLFPATAAVAGVMPVPIEDEFSFGLDLLLSGLARLRDEADRTT